MKKTIAILLALCMLMALCACGDKEEPTVTDAPAQGGVPAKTELPAKSETPDQPDAPAKAEAPAKPDSPAKAEADSPAGYYKLAETTGEGTTEDASEMEALGLVYYLVLEPDGTGYMEILGEKDPLNWDDRYFSSEDTEPSEYTYADGRITIGDEESSMVFVRLTEEEEANFRENGSGSLEDIFGGLLEEGERFDTEGRLEGSYIKFIGAEATEDDDGKPAVYVWYEYTNLSDQITSVYTDAYVSAAQNGETLDIAFKYEGAPEAAYSSLSVAPNYTIRCAELFSYDPDGGEIEFSCGAIFGDKVVYTLDPEDLPGAPADDFVLGDPDFGTDYMDGLEDVCDSLTILEAEAVEDYVGEESILVHLSFTNTSEETQSFFACYDVFALQDGAGLARTFSDDYSDEQDNVYAEVAPGDSIDLAVVFALRGDSPVAFAAKGTYDFGDSYLGCVYEQS